MPRKATIGPEIFTRVNALVAEGQKRTDAFAQVAQERGSRPGSVAANYYRVARTSGQSKPRRTTRRAGRKATTATASRQRRTTAARPVATSASTSGDINQIAQQIAELTEQLIRQVSARDQRIRQLLG